jgi:hypothetical protein
MIKHKYRSVKTELDGIKFDSKKEAAYYQALKLRKQAGDVVQFLRQVPFDLPGGVKYRVDFLEFWADGTVHWIDVKGFQTQEFKAKRKMVEQLYAPIEIELR